MESLGTKQEEVWDAAYWADVDTVSSEVKAKIAERLAAVDRAAAPSSLASTSYHFRAGEVREGELDEVGRLRPVSQTSTREASMGIDDLVEPSDIVSVRVIGAVSLAPEFSDPDQLPNYHD